MRFASSSGLEGNMQCEDCFGIGEVLIDGTGKPVMRLRDAYTMIPCPSCGGTGIQSCCEGACGNAADVTNTGDPA
jgi:hypothetical protein